MKDGVIKRIKVNQNKTVNNNCLIRGVLNKEGQDELTLQERKEFEMLIDLSNT